MTQAAGKFNAVARKIKNCSPAAGFFRILPRARMKAIIVITPKKAVLDPQGKTVQNALAQMGYTGVTGVHIGKYIEIDLQIGNRMKRESLNRYIVTPGDDSRFNDATI